MKPSKFRRGLLAALCTSAMFIAACSSDDDESSTTTAESTETTEAAGDPILEEAKRITELAAAGMVYAPSDTDQSAADIVAMDSWLGPESTPEAPADVKIAILYCAPGTACEVAANLAKTAAESLGWTVESIAGAGTPESFATAFDTALAGDPDVIMTLAMPDLAVGASLAKAREAGVVTISVADAENAADPNNAYDVYVSYRMPLMHQINAYAIIADSEAQAKVLLVNDSAFPNLVLSNTEFKRVMDLCEACEVTEVDWQITDALDPVKAQTAISNFLQSNPDVGYVVVPYSINLSAVVEGVRAAGKEDSVTVVAKDGDDVGLAEILKGGSKFNAGVSLEWISYAALDEAVRALTGNEPTPTANLGVGVHLFTAENTPADGKAEPAYLSAFDWKSEYLSLWGLG